jgi:hypothetical protein
VSPLVPINVSPQGALNATYVREVNEYQSELSFRQDGPELFLSERPLIQSLDVAMDPQHMQTHM